MSLSGLTGSPSRGCIHYPTRAQVSFNKRVAVLPSSGKSRELLCLERSCRKNNWAGSTQRRNILRTPLLKCAMDVITSAPTPRRSARKQPLVETSMSASPALDHGFLSAEAKARFKFFRGKDFIVERVRDSVFDDMKITRMLEERSLLFSVDFPTVYYPRLVSEFYSNLVQDVENPGSEQFGLVYVRGKFVNFSPSQINRFLQTPNPPAIPPMVDLDFLASNLTNGRCTKWHNKFRCSKMTSLFSFLFKVATFNWKPSMSKSNITITQADLIYRVARGIEFNLGEIVFPCVTQHAEKELDWALPFPCLISALCLDQGVELTDFDYSGVKVVKFGIKPLLNSSNRTIDLPVAFAEYPPPATATQDDVSAPPPVDPVQVLQGQLSFVESEMLVARDHFSSLKSQRRNLITAIASLTGQTGGASTSQVFEDLDPDFHWSTLGRFDNV